MPLFLCFTLEGQLASWGDIAPGEQRTSWARPSKSAALGIVAAALGIERTEEPRVAALHDGLGFAVLIESAGLPMTEFQTEQRPTTPGLNNFRRLEGRPPATRAESLEIDEIATSISRRSFHVGTRHRIALWGTGDKPWDLLEICAALERPVFAIFLGRRAFSPSRPLAPQVAEAETLEEALTNYIQADQARLAFRAPATVDRFLMNRIGNAGVELWCDADTPPPLRAHIFQETNTRRDTFRSTKPRMFGDRLEGRVRFEMPSEISQVARNGGPAS